MKGFSDFLLESYVYYLSDFRNVLKKISEDPIAKDLLNIELKDIDSNNTFISLGKSDGYVGASEMEKLQKTIIKKYKEFAKIKGISSDSIQSIIDDKISELDSGKFKKEEIDDFFYNFQLNKKSRNEFKLGKFINNYFPDKYTPKAIEDFTNKFKSALNEEKYIFKLVDGEEIEKWYDVKNYKEEKYTLGGSCMAKKSGIFDFYIDNPQVCKMLILLEDDKLVGRALLWKVSFVNGKEVEDFWYLDRQYTTEEFFVEKFRNKAKENGWYFRTKNDYGSESITNPKTGKVEFLDMSIRIPFKEWKKYPYLDTFKWYDIQNNLLCNYDVQEDVIVYILNGTNGDYEDSSGYYSDYEDRTISRERAVWSDSYNSWLDSETSVEVFNGNGKWWGWYPEDSDEVVYDKISQFWININDAVYCDWEGYYILDKEAVLVIVDIFADDFNVEDDFFHHKDERLVSIDNLNDSLWYKWLISKTPNAKKYLYILKDILVKNYKGELIPESLSEEVYLCGDKWLNQIDALSLGYQIGKEKKVIDLIEYTNSIQSLIPEIKLKIKELNIKLPKLKKELIRRKTTLEVDYSFHQ